MPIIAVEGFTPPPALTTDQLGLRFHRMGDLDRLVELIGNIEVARYLARVPHPYSRSEGESFITATMNGVTAEGELVYAITLKGEDGIIGAAGLMMDGGGAELGYWLGEPYWGRGYAREAGAALIDLAFGALSVDRVYANVRAENQPSRRLLAALGFRERGEASVYQMIEKRAVMGPHYEIVQDDWKGRHP